MSAPRIPPRANARATRSSASPSSQGRVRSTYHPVNATTSGDVATAVAAAEYVDRDTCKSVEAILVARNNQIAADRERLNEQLAYLDRAEEQARLKRDEQIAASHELTADRIDAIYRNFIRDRAADATSRVRQLLVEAGLPAGGECRFEYCQHPPGNCPHGE